MMVTDHMNYLTFEDPAAVNLVRRALKLAQAGDLYGAAETASVDVAHAAVVSEGLRRGMHFSIGAELDNDPRSRPDAQNIVDAMRPDAMIRSVHFLAIDHPTAGPNYTWNFDNPEFIALYDHVGTERTWQLYMEALLKAIEEQPGQIVGHFYVPAIFGHWPERATLERYEDQIVAAAKSKGMAIEFNTRFLYRDHAPEEKQRYLEAHKRLLRKCRDAGVMISVGSDAHSPKDQGGAFDIVLDLLDELDINEIAFPLGGRMARVALRVIQPEPPPPPVVEKRTRSGSTRKTVTPARQPERKSPKPAVKPAAKPPAKPAAKSAKVKKAPPPKKAGKKAAAKRPAPAKKLAPPKRAKASAAKATSVKATSVKATSKKPAAKKPVAKKAAPKRSMPAKKSPKKAGKRR